MMDLGQYGQHSRGLDEDELGPADDADDGVGTLVGEDPVLDPEVAWVKTPAEYGVLGD